MAIRSKLSRIDSTKATSGGMAGVENAGSDRDSKVHREERDISIIGLDPSLATEPYDGHGYSAETLERLALLEAGELDLTPVASDPKRSKAATKSNAARRRK